MFFVSDKSSITLRDIECCLNECNSIKYAAYRTAAKLRVIQKAFYMDKVELKVISSIFERHQLQQTENSVQLDEKEVESILMDIYFVIKKRDNMCLDLDKTSHLLFNFLLNVFDKKMSSTVQVLSFKVGLILLCEAKPREKYHYLFEQLADHNNCLSKKKLEIVLKKIIMLTEHLGEGLSFGSQLVPGTVESCFQFNNGSLGLSEDIFMSWLMQDPQLLVWLSTLYRMQISESVSHNTKCGICKIYPLVGLRYRCLRCLSYDMCQLCFFTGKLNKKHKLKHPVQEFCCPMTSQQSTRTFLLTLKNRLYKKECKLQYLPALRVDSNELQTMGQSTRLLDEMEISARTVINGSRISLHKFPYKELQNIILQLEIETEKIIPQIDNFCSGVKNSDVDECKTHLKNCLLKHKSQIRTQVQRLKLLRNYLASNVKMDRKAFLASTPVADQILSKSQKRDLNVDLATLSPITVRTYKKRAESEREKMIWDNYDLGAYCLNPSWEEVRSENPKNNTRGASGVSKEASDRMALKNDDSYPELSTWLGGKTLREMDSSSKKGLSWLYDNDYGKSEEQKMGEESEEILEEVQSDLKKILDKLQELSVVTYRGNDHERETVTQEDIEMLGNVDALLIDLISGIEKLIET